MKARLWVASFIRIGGIIGITMALNGMLDSYRKLHMLAIASGADISGIPDSLWPHAIALSAGLFAAYAMDWQRKKGSQIRIN